MLRYDFDVVSDPRPVKPVAPPKERAPAPPQGEGEAPPEAATDEAAPAG